MFEILIVMNLTKSCQKMRLGARHGNDGEKVWIRWLSKMFNLILLVLSYQSSYKECVSLILLIKITAITSYHL